MREDQYEAEKLFLPSTPRKTEIRCDTIQFFRKKNPSSNNINVYLAQQSPLNLDMIREIHRTANYVRLSYKYDVNSPGLDCEQIKLLSDLTPMNNWNKSEIARMVSLIDKGIQVIQINRRLAVSESSNINLREQPSGTVINLISSLANTLEVALRITHPKDLHSRRRIIRALSNTCDIVNEAITDDVMADFPGEDDGDDTVHEISDTHPSVQSPTLTLNSPELVILPDIPSAPDSGDVQLEPAAPSDVPPSNVRPSIALNYRIAPAKKALTPFNSSSDASTQVSPLDLFGESPLDTPPTLLSVCTQTDVISPTPSISSQSFFPGISTCEGTSIDFVNVCTYYSNLSLTALVTLEWLNNMIQHRVPRRALPSCTVNLLCLLIPQLMDTSIKGLTPCQKRTHHSARADISLHAQSPSAQGQPIPTGIIGEVNPVDPLDIARVTQSPAAGLPSSSRSHLIPRCCRMQEESTGCLLRHTGLGQGFLFGLSHDTPTSFFFTPKSRMVALVLWSLSSGISILQQASNLLTA
ncbi:unnamed protein product [Lepeophtheirus salmonis]|uniref:(salmon louse) hypothetical protein n=1 Tax=Lepeophtheirus salmonis TaxID=72036 RepID=A0A817FG77_LEPSM|nr:unnamed protein product [Lepeophtheirus salmonis]